MFEKHAAFQVLPTFGVIPSFEAVAPFEMSELVPNFSMKQLLHGEQYLEILENPIPTDAELIAFPFLIDVSDKGKSANITTGVIIKNAQTNADVFYTESTVVVRGSGGFSGIKKPQDAGKTRSGVVSKVPSRSPDATTEELVGADQASLYRLSGDYNPLHIDPAFSKASGFDVPIVHGLCFFGMSSKHVLQKYGQIKNVKARFVGSVLPGQTLQTEMWIEGFVVVFQTRVKETGLLCISNANAQLLGGNTRL